MLAESMSEESLKDVPLDKLAEMPPNTVEPEIAIRRALESDAKVSKLKRELLLERSQRRQLQQDVELLLAQSEVMDALTTTVPESYATYAPPEEAYSGGDAAAIFVLTDWHYEEQVDPSTVNNLNAFSPEIAKKRLECVTQRFLTLLDSVRSLSNIKQIVIPVLGDLITGHLHDDQKESNHMFPTEALLEVRDQLHAVIDTVAKESGIQEIDIYTSNGNHGRTVPKPRVSTAYKTSYEWLLYRWMEKDYRNSHIRWHVSNSYFNMAHVCGKTLRFHHGDSIKYNGGVGGITIPVLKAIRNWDDGLKSDLDFFGHWHQFMWHPKFVACNCLIGYSAYAQMRVKAPFSLPSQTFAVIDRDRPGAVDVREIYCD